MIKKTLRILFNVLFGSLLFFSHELSYASSGLHPRDRPHFNPFLYPPSQTHGQALTPEEWEKFDSVISNAERRIQNSSGVPVNRCEDPFSAKPSRPALRTISHNFARKVIEQVRSNSPDVTALTEVEGNLRKLTIAPTSRNRETRVKQIEIDTYDGPKTEDFLDRLDVIRDTALDQVEQIASLRPKTTQDHEISELKKRIRELTEQFRKQLLADAKIDWRRAQKNLKRDDNEYILEKIENATSIINLYAAALAPLIPTKSGQPLQLKNLKKLEDEYTKKTGRQNIVNIYQTERDGPQYVSIHRPFERTGEVQPSAIRDRPGLSNALETSLHIINKSGQPVVLFSAYRHSSYTPLSITHEYERKKVVIQNFKDLISKMTKNYKKANEGQCPKSINLSTMSLFTPVKGDKTLRGKESEIRQLEDTYFVTRMFDGQTMSIEGCQVIPKTTYMNIGANQFDVAINGSKFGKLLLGSSEERAINAKGYSDFEDDVHEFLSENLERVKIANKELGLNSRARKKSGLNPEESRRLKNVLRSLDFLKEKYEKVEDSIAKPQKKILALKDQLKIKYQALDQNSSNKDQFMRLSKEIDQEEKELKKLYLEISQSYKKLYAADDGMLRRIEKSVVSEISNLTRDFSAEAKSEKMNLLRLLKNQRDMIQLYSDNKKLYWTKKIYTSEHKTDFQRNYLIAHYLMGHDIDFFCKSAEDRTGLVNNKIEEAMIFRMQFGRYPRLDQPGDQERLDQIASHVYHGGASRDTTGMNNRGARGLQINVKGQYRNQGKVESKMGVFAKKVYAKPKKSSEK